MFPRTRVTIIGYKTTIPMWSNCTEKEWRLFVGTNTRLSKIPDNLVYESVCWGFRRVATMASDKATIDPLNRPYSTPAPQKQLNHPLCIATNIG